VPARNSFLLAILVLTTTACRQTASKQETPKPLGTVNGKPIPAKIFTVTRIQAINALRRDGKLAPDGTADESVIAAEMQDYKCERLRSAIASEARAQAVIDFKIRPTEQDLAEAVRTLRTGDPVKEVAALHDRTAVIVNALSAVYDKGMAPDDVYRTMVASHGIPEEAWKAELETGRTAAGRAMIARPLTVTPQMYAQGIPAAVHSLAVSMKLNDALNEMIAGTDPVFRSYLARWKTTARTVNGQTGHNMGWGEVEYMQKKRAAWWDERVSKLKIVLNDPSLAIICKLAQTAGSAAVSSLQ
jgi:hypothetical protein